MLNFTFNNFEKKGKKKGRSKEIQINTPIPFIPRLLWTSWASQCSPSLGGWREFRCIHQCHCGTPSSYCPPFSSNYNYCCYATSSSWWQWWTRWWWRGGPYPPFLLVDDAQCLVKIPSSNSDGNGGGGGSYCYCNLPRPHWEKGENEGMTREKEKRKGHEPPCVFFLSHNKLWGT